MATEYICSRCGRKDYSADPYSKLPCSRCGYIENEVERKRVEKIKKRQHLKLIKN